MRWVIAFLVLTAPAAADTVVATRTLRAQTLVGPADVTLIDQDIAGTYRSLDEVVGQETRGVLYAGRPVTIADLGPPAVIERNQVVPVIYDTGGMRIVAEGRALARAGLGETIRIMNLSSHTIITGWVAADGSVSVGPARDPGNDISN